MFDQPVWIRQTSAEALRLQPGRSRSNRKQFVHGITSKCFVKACSGTQQVSAVKRVMIQGQGTDLPL